MLINAAQQLIETVDEALAWLGSGVDKDTPDDMLLSVFTLKVSPQCFMSLCSKRALVRQERQHLPLLHTILLRSTFCLPHLQATG